jgi:hypothetical protein
MNAVFSHGKRNEKAIQNLEGLAGFLKLFYEVANPIH